MNDDLLEVEPLSSPVAPAEEPIGADGVGELPGAPPPSLPLAPISRVLPALERRLSSTLPSRQVDVEGVARQWSRGLALRRIPFRPLRAWAPRVTVLVDHSVHLYPFWEDQDRLLPELQRRLGRTAAVRHVAFLEGFSPPWRERGLHRLIGHVKPPVEPGVPVLVLGDLGALLGDPRRVVEWVEVADRLRQAGGSAVALLPCPVSRCPKPLAARWDVVEWEKPLRAAQRGRQLTAGERAARTERLLILAAFTAGVGPELLRTLRRLLPAGEADAGTEADTWALIAGISGATGLRPLRRALQRRFAEEPDALKVGAVEAMRRRRAGGPVENWLDEVAALEAGARLPPGTLTEEEVKEARTFWQRIAASVEGGSSPQVREAAAAFARRSLDAVTGRQPPEGWHLNPIFGRVWAASWKGEGPPPLPAGVGPEVLAWVGNRHPRRWRAWQVGDSLSFVPAKEAPPAGSPLAEVESANGLVAVFASGDRQAPARQLAGLEPIPLPAAVPSLLLRTDRTAATLRQITRPEWASGMGRDRFGLWLSIRVGEVETRLRWVPPGRFWMGSPESEAGRWADEGPRHLETIREGFWMGETPCTQALWQEVMGENPSRFKTPERPVEQVSWEDCQRFCAKLGKRVGGAGWRLPAEAEWEYACRAGTEAATWAGELEIVDDKASLLDVIAWYSGNSATDFELEGQEKGTHPVARKQPNPWGLHDMLGNVWEWCQDPWRDSYTAEPGGSNRVYRGGSWLPDARPVRAACRNHGDPSYRGGNLGFRLARGQSAPSGAEPQNQGAERPAGRARRGTRRRGEGSRPEGAT